MSEKINVTHETEHTPEGSREHQEHLPVQPETSVENTTHEHKENLDKILNKIEKTATSQEDFKRQKKQEEKALHQNKHVLADSQLRESTLKRTLRSVRKDLKPYQRPFSKLIHNNVVDQVSEVSSKTIARPDGLLVGGIASFLTSLVVLAACRYYGYEYNYLIGLVSFPAGFALGIIGEFLFKPLKKN